MCLLRPQRLLRLTHVVAHAISAFRCHPHAVRVERVPTRTLGNRGDSEPGPVGGRAAVGDREETVESRGEQNVGLAGMEGYAGDLVFVVVQRHAATLRWDIPQFHRRVRAAGGEDVAILVIPTQTHHCLSMASCLQRALSAADQAAQNALRLHHVDYVRVPDFDLRTEGTYCYVTSAG